MIRTKPSIWVQHQLQRKIAAWLMHLSTDMTGTAHIHDTEWYDTVKRYDVIVWEDVSGYSRSGVTHQLAHRVTHPQNLDITGTACLNGASSHVPLKLLENFSCVLSISTMDQLSKTTLYISYSQSIVAWGLFRGVRLCKRNFHTTTNFEAIA